MPIISTADAQVDPIFLGIGISICLIVLALFLKHERELNRKKKRESASQPHCNLQSISKVIIRDIQSCWDEDELPRLLGRIRQFEFDHYGALNLGFYLKQLNNAYEQQKTNIYREQLRADEVLREMKII